MRVLTRPDTKKCQGPFGAKRTSEGQYKDSSVKCPLVLTWIVGFWYYVEGQRL